MAGNITQVKDGYYRLRYRDSSKYVKAKSDREAQKALAKFITEVDSGDFKQPSKVTFKEFIQKWEKEYANIHLQPMTLYRYRIMLDKKIIPELGSKKLEKITPLDLMEFYNRLRKDGARNDKVKIDDKIVNRPGGLSEQSIKHHHRLICSLFEKAIKWGLLKSQNPAKAVDAPKATRKKDNYYNEKQVQALLDALENVGPEELKYRVATMLALMTGARRGEILGLEWQDINTDEKAIEIRQASQYIPGKGVFAKSPKNQTSERRISVNDTLLDLLQEYKESQRKKGYICRDNNRLFVTWDNKPMMPQTISKWFQVFLAKNKLQPLTFHGLRHTSATFLISRGMDIETVAGRLGHSTSATTHNIYSHFLKSKDRQAADIMEDTFSKKKKENKGQKIKGV